MQTLKLQEWVPKTRIGADYYPEHWEKERWKTDAEMMVKANIKVIRIK